jgi:DNA-directed RNA polymerase specialized sigma24 family protein
LGKHPYEAEPAPVAAFRREDPRGGARAAGLGAGSRSRATARAATVPVPEPVTLHLERIVAGDGASRAWLWDRFATRLYRRMCGRYAGRGGLDPDELLQDAFLFFFQHDARVLSHFLGSVPPGEQTEARLDGYLWGLACGIASNHRRSTRRRKAVLTHPVEPARDPVDAEKQSLDRDVLARLTKCLERGGSRVFLYYKLRFVDGLTPEEIARVTGWSRKATYKLKLALNDTVLRCAKRLRIS